LRVTLPQRPAKSRPKRAWRCWKVHFERSGAKGSKAVSPWSAGGRHLDHRLWGIGVRGISIAFARKWLKSSSRNCPKSLDRAQIKALRASETGQKGPYLAVLHWQKPSQSAAPTSFRTVSLGNLVNRDDPLHLENVHCRACSLSAPSGEGVTNAARVQQPCSNPSRKHKNRAENRSATIPRIWLI
jgi:hypothetical protein